ncbi:MAG: LytTR family DNA-binding domain-containing protein [Myxococcota bacterium]
MSAVGPILVADDERFARLAIRGALSVLDDIPPIVECETGRETIEITREQSPSLIFLDVGLPDFDGFEVLRQLPEPGPPVVMVTASSDHAVEAYDGNVVDYVVKPFSDARLLRAARRGLQARVLETIAPVADQLLSEGRLPTLDEVAARLARFAIRTHSRTQLVPFDDVDFILADGNYAVLVVGERRHHLRIPLAELEARYGNVFRRIHRSHLVNVDRVTTVRRLPSGDARVVLRDGRELRMSRRYRSALEADRA